MEKSLLKDLAQRLTSGETTSVEIMNSYFDKIEKSDDKIGAFLEANREEALAQAQESDKRRQGGNALSEFDGLPIGIKDNIVIKGRASGCASKILEGFVSPYTATAIEKLSAKGMLPVGRLNMDEFAMGSSTENSAYQQTKNPHDLERAPGGSSGGSAAAVAAGFMPVTLGSDTGGSIRQPAAFTGITGLKPTYGSVSRYGLIAFASSLDQIGPLSQSVADSKIVYDIIKGHDPHDSTTIPENQRVPKSYDMKKLKIGVPRGLIERVDPSVRASFEKTLEFLSKEVAPEGEVVDINLDNQKFGIAVYYLIATSEASANLARFDGVRYGNRTKEAGDLLELYEKTRSAGFGAEVKRRILLGTYALSSGYYEAYYGKAQRVRRLIQDDYRAAFGEVDMIVMPTTPTEAFKIGEKSDPIAMYLSDELTVGASLAGIPAISLPGPTQGLPIGIQLQGDFFSEEMLFDVGARIEAAFPAKTVEL